MLKEKERILPKRDMGATGMMGLWVGCSIYLSGVILYTFIHLYTYTYMLIYTHILYTLDIIL